LNICDIDDGALDTEFDLTPGGWLWQDQTIFSNLAHAGIKYDFESEEGFTFCAADTEDGGRECPPFNTLSTEKLKEVVTSAKTTFKWQSSKEGEALRDNPLQRLDIFKASGTETNLMGNQQ